MSHRERRVHAAAPAGGDGFTLCKAGSVGHYVPDFTNDVMRVTCQRCTQRLLLELIQLRAARGRHATQAADNAARPSPAARMR
jgi:hypothetical protein